MRSRLFLSIIAAASLVASTAYAGALTTATWSQNLQGIALTATNMGAVCVDTLTTHTYPSSTITCPVAGIGATGSLAAGTYSVGLTMPLFAGNLFTTGGTININTMFSLAGAQMITGTMAAAGATMGVAGKVTVMNAIHSGMAGPNLSMFLPGMTTLVKLPLSAGKAGTFTGNFTVLGSFHYITVDFYAWTPGTSTFTGLTTMAAALPNVVAMGSFMTAMDGGTITLVSASRIAIDGPAAQRRTAGFTTLKLTFLPSVPEPSTLLLLGAGVVGLALVGSRKR